MVDVNAAKHNQHGEQHKGNAKLPPAFVQTKAQIRKRVNHGGYRLHNHIAGRNPCAAKSALAAQEQPAEYGEHIVPFQPVSAGEAVRRLGYKRLLKRGAQYHHVKEAADYRAEDKGKNTIHNLV